MQVNLHKNSRTTLKVREEISSSSDPIAVIARKYSLDWKTVKKWRSRKVLTDKSSRPKVTRSDLSTKEEDLICFQRRQFKSTIDEIYLTLVDQITDKRIYPMKIYRCLKRHGLEVLPKELKQAERKIRKFKRYKIGYIHIDFIHTKRFDRKRYYIFTCIDRVSKLAYVKLTDGHKARDAVEFLDKVLDYYPYKINYVLTDNGSEFNDRVNRKHPFIRPKKEHEFEKRCRERKVEYRRTQFKSPWTNGMVERFNRKIREKVTEVRYFSTVEELAEDLEVYINRYNEEIKLKSLDYRSPIEYLREEKKIEEGELIKLKQSRTTYRY